MPNLYQGHIDGIYATLRAWEKVAPRSPEMIAHHAALAAGFATLQEDNPDLVTPDDGDPKP